MTIDINNLKAEFGAAYLRAVAHAAGFFVQESHRMLDADGVDYLIFRRGKQGQRRAPKVAVQLKTTSRLPAAAELVVDLSVKNYDELRDEDSMLPRILVVVVVPEDAAQWLQTSEEQLVMRRCGYWSFLRGAPAKDNTSSVRVKISRDALFNVEQLRAQMDLVARGDR